MRIVLVLLGQLPDQRRRQRDLAAILAHGAAENPERVPPGSLVGRRDTGHYDVPGEGVTEAYFAEPHEMPASLQRQVGCVIGKDYPRPIVDHAEARARALHAYELVRRR